MKFKSRPVEVSAVQFLCWRGNKPAWSDEPRWLKERLSLHESSQFLIAKSGWCKGCLFVGRDHPDYIVHKGDWLVNRRGMTELEIISDRQFKKKYEPA